MMAKRRPTVPTRARLLAYRTPAVAWTDGLPLGNGRQAVLVAGRADHDVWQVNDTTCWSGNPESATDGDLSRAAAPETVAAVRAALFRGDPHQAEHLAYGLQLGRPQSYQPLGSVRITPAIAAAPVRWLDLSTAVAGRDEDVESALADPYGLAPLTGAADARVLASEPAQAAVGRHRYAVPTDVEIELTAAHAEFGRHRLQVRAAGLELIARMPSLVLPPSEPSPTPVVFDDASGAALTAVLALEARTDGQLVPGEGSLSVLGATWLELAVSTATDFVDARTRPHGDVERLQAEARARCTAALDRGWRAVTDDHRRHHSQFYDRLELTIGEPAAPEGAETAAPVVVWPDEVLARPETQPLDLELLTTAVQLGRYLLISASPPPGRAANLQGQWNERIRPPWGSGYTININTQMNYWPAGPANLIECAEPLLDLVETMATTGAQTAREVYGLPGWVAHHNTDLWGFTLPVGRGTGRPAWSLWPLGGAWLCLEVIEHRRFAGSAARDLERTWPLLDGLVSFFLAWLVELPDGTLGTAPSTSPENTYLADGEAIGVGISSTMDLALIRGLLTTWLELDPARTERGLPTAPGRAPAVRSALARLPELQPTDDGLIPEWWGNPPGAEPEHRHQSHLVGFYPGLGTATEGHRAVLDEAAKASLRARGPRSTGWSLAWRLALWSRLGEPAEGIACLRQLLGPAPVDETEPGGQMVESGGSYRNLFSAHPPFQIDGNFGLTAGVLEMVVQSHRERNGRRVIQLLPALPTELATGAVRGLRCRGGVDVTMAWRDGRVESVELTSAVDQDVIVQVDDVTLQVRLRAGQPWQGPVHSLGDRSRRMRALLVMGEHRRDLVYPSDLLEELAQDVTWVAPPMTATELAADPSVLDEVEVIFTGWGGPQFSAELLDHAPKLHTVLMAAGSVRSLTSPEFWARGVQIVSAAAANAIPVVEYAFAQVILGLKQAHRIALEARTERLPDKSTVRGAYGTTVGLVSFGLIGHDLAERLQTLDVEVIGYDPLAPAPDGVTPATLDEVFARSDVVSLHTPALPETRGMITRELIASMKLGATLLNTARGEIVDEAGLIEVLSARPDLTAVLDVTWPEPPAADSPLRTLPNVVLTGHLAGSHGLECRRLGELVAAEARRLVRGEPLQHAVDPSTAAHRA